MFSLWFPSRSYSYKSDDRTVIKMKMYKRAHEFQRKRKENIAKCVEKSELQNKNDTNEMKSNERNQIGRKKKLQ